MMTRLPNLVYLVILVALGILIAGGWSIWHDASSSPTTSVDAAPSRVHPGISESEAPASSTISDPPPTALPSPATLISPAGSPIVNPAEAKPEPSPPLATPAKVNWDERLEQLLDSDFDEKQMGEHILALWPFLASSNRVEAAQYMVDFMPDESYASLLPILTNPATDGEVLDEFMTELLNRPDELQLNVFLDVARIPNHPRQETALDYLELYVEEDYGQDWAKWEQAVQRYLKENADF